MVVALLSTGIGLLKGKLKTLGWKSERESGKPFERFADPGADHHCRRPRNVGQGATGRP